MNLIDNIEDQTREVVKEDYKAWLLVAPLGQLYAEYHGLISHIKEQMQHALNEHESGESLASVRRAHFIMLQYPERLRLVTIEINKRVGGYRISNS